MDGTFAMYYKLENKMVKYFRLVYIIFFTGLFFASKGYTQVKAHKRIISTKMVVLTYKHNDSSSLADQKDTLNIPVVSDKYPGLKKALAFENIGNEDGLQATIKNYAACACGITSLNYEVVYESNDILSIKIFTEWMGSYPSENTLNLTSNIHTGAAYPISNEINSAGLKWIYSTYKKLIKKRIALDYASNKGNGENEDTYNDLIKSIDTLTSAEMQKNYLFTNSGIIFNTDGILPHVIQSFEPDRHWLIPYKKLQQYKQPHAIVL